MGVLLERCVFHRQINAIKYIVFMVWTMAPTETSFFNFIWKHTSETKTIIVDQLVQSNHVGEQTNYQLVPSSHVNGHKTDQLALSNNGGQNWNDQSTHLLGGLQMGAYKWGPTVPSHKVWSGPSTHWSSERKYGDLQCERCLGSDKPMELHWNEHGNTWTHLSMHS